MKALLFILFPLFASAQIRPYQEPTKGPVRYKWEQSIAPASLAMCAGMAGGRDNTSKFVRQGFVAGACLTIGFSDRKPRLHYLYDVGIGAAAFVVGAFVGENLIYK